MAKLSEAQINHLKKLNSLPQSTKGRFQPGLVGPLSPHWKGGRHVRADGYVFVMIPNNGRSKAKAHAGRCYIPVAEHILIAEKALGRFLKKGEVVHHINCNPSDNRNSNLLVCRRGYHKWLHDEMGRRYAKEKFKCL